MGKSLAQLYDKYWSSAAGRNENAAIRRRRQEAHEYAYSLVGEDLRGQRVLDAGCGVGDDLIVLAELGANMIGIDVSRQALAQAAKKLKEKKLSKKVTLKQLALERLDFGEEEFDIVWLNSVLMYLNPAAALGECQRVVKKGGRVIIVEPLKFCPLVWLYRRLFFAHARESNPQHLSLRQLLQLGEGFSQVRHREFYFLGLPLVSQLDLWLQQNVSFLREFYWIAVLELVK